MMNALPLEVQDIIIDIAINNLKNRSSLKIQKTWKNYKTKNVIQYNLVKIVNSIGCFTIVTPNLLENILLMAERVSYKFIHKNNLIPEFEYIIRKLQDQNSRRVFEGKSDKIIGKFNDLIVDYHMYYQQ